MTKDKSSCRAVRVEHHPESPRPWRIISDPWAEGKPQTTIAITEEQAKEIRSQLPKSQQAFKETSPLAPLPDRFPAPGGILKKETN